MIKLLLFAIFILYLVLSGIAIEKAPRLGPDIVEDILARRNRGTSGQTDVKSIGTSSSSGQGVSPAPAPPNSSTGLASSLAGTVNLGADIHPEGELFSGQMNFAAQKHSFSNDNDPDQGAYPDLDIEFFKTSKPLHSGSTVYVGHGFETDSVSIYGSPTLNFRDIALNYTGYIHVKKSGSYTFGFSSTLNLVLAWVGDVACKEYTRSNACFIIDSRSGVLEDETCAFTEGKPCLFVS